MKNAQRAILSCMLILTIQVVGTLATAADYNTGFTCSAATAGRQLSPIDITPTTCTNIAVFDLSFTSASAPFVMDNTTWFNYVWTPSSSWGTLGAVAADYGVDNYTASSLQFKTPSEHTIRGAPAPLEVQIYFKSKNSSRTDVMFSFLVYRSKPPGQAYTSQFINNYFTNAVFDNTTQVGIDLSGLAARVNQYPLFYRYPGTTVVPGCGNVIWYVYSSPLYVANNTVIENFRNAIWNFYNISYNATVILKNVTDAYDGVSVMSNAGAQHTITIGEDLIERFCYKEFWRNHIPFNYGIWFALGILVIFFCCQLCVGSSKPIRDSEYKESVLTIHPLYSLGKVSNEIFTRRTRFTVLWMNATNNAIITSIMAANNKVIKGNNEGIVGADLFTYALVGSACGGAFTYIWGFFLRKYYVAKWRLWKEKTKEGGDAAKIEKHEEDANFWLYFFYFLAFAWMWGGNLIFVWQMNYINPIDRIGVPGMQNLDMSVRWMATFFISLGIDWFVLDVIHVILAFILPFYRHILKWRGYMYDKICHETYMMYSKED